MSSGASRNSGRLIGWRIASFGHREARLYAFTSPSLSNERALYGSPTRMTKRANAWATCSR